MNGRDYYAYLIFKRYLITFQARQRGRVTINCSLKHPILLHLLSYLVVELLLLTPFSIDIFMLPNVARRG